MKIILTVLGKLILILTSVVVTLGIAEIVFAKTNPFGFRLRGNKIVLPSNIVVSRANKQTEKLDKEIIVKKNSLGFRGAEPPKNFDSGLTIVTAGGSTTECIVLSEGQTWVDKLGGKLTKNFDSVWINNAGMDGLSTFGLNILLSDYIIAVKPKYVTFLVGINDLAIDSARERDVFSKKEINNASLWLADKSALWSSIYNLYRTDKTKKMGMTSSEVVDFKKLPVYENTESYPDYRIMGAIDYKANSRENDKEFNENKHLAEYKKRLIDLAKKSEKAGIKPVFITQPAVYGGEADPTTGVNLSSVIVDDTNGEWGQGMRGSEKWAILEKYNEVTREVGQSQGAILVDLAKLMPKDTKYFYDFVHYSIDGAEEVSRIIYKELCPQIQKDFPDFQSQKCESN